jgi:hypothetical protein
MEMRKRRRNWLLRRVILGLAVAAVVVPTAQARVDGSTGWTGPMHADNTIDQRVWPGIDPTSGKDYRAVPVRHVDQRVWPGIDPTSGKDYRAVPVQVVSGADSFDWGDAGIGAGVLAAVTALGAAGLATARRTGRQATA